VRASLGRSAPLDCAKSASPSQGMMPFAVPFRDLLGSPKSPAARAAALAGALSLPKERICCLYISGATNAHVHDARSGCACCERERALTMP
jgi:hypothetical protein